jgi:hypothetical protein
MSHKLLTGLLVAALSIGSLCLAPEKALAAPLLAEDFDGLTLGLPVDETSGDTTAFTHTPLPGGFHAPAARIRATDRSSPFQQGILSPISKTPGIPWGQIRVQSSQPLLESNLYRSSWSPGPGTFSLNSYHVLEAKP